MNLAINIKNIHKLIQEWDIQGNEIPQLNLENGELTISPRKEKNTLETILSYFQSLGRENFETEFKTIFAITRQYKKEIEKEISHRFNEEKITADDFLKEITTLQEIISLNAKIIYKLLDFRLAVSANSVRSIWGDWRYQSELAYKILMFRYNNFILRNKQYENFSKLLSLKENFYMLVDKTFIFAYAKIHEKECIFECSVFKDLNVLFEIKEKDTKQLVGSLFLGRVDEKNVNIILDFSPIFDRATQKGARKQFLGMIEKIRSFHPSFKINIHDRAKQKNSEEGKTLIEEFIHFFNQMQVTSPKEIELSDFPKGILVRRKLSKIQVKSENKSENKIENKAKKFLKPQ